MPVDWPPPASDDPTPAAILTDQLVQRKLNQLAQLCNELDAAVKRRYGPNAFLFYESGGTFHIMVGDSDGNMQERQEYVRHSSDGVCHLGAGAW